MALQNRNGNQYYTRSKREGGKITREYVGSGVLAQFAAWDDQLKRLAAERERHEQQARLEREREAAEALDQAVNAVCIEADAAFREAMAAAGYHQHARGTWRKKRQAQSQGQDAQNEAGGSTGGVGS